MAHVAEWKFDEVKELKELIRDPKILVGMIVLPLLMFPVLGLVLGYAVETAQEQAQQATLLVVNNDGGNWSQTFIDYLKNIGLKITVENNLAPQQIIDQGLLIQNNSTQFIEIPSGFSTNMTQHTNGNLEIIELTYNASSELYEGFFYNTSEVYTFYINVVVNDTAGKHRQFSLS